MWASFQMAMAPEIRILKTAMDRHILSVGSALFWCSCMIMPHVISDRLVRAQERYLFIYHVLSEMLLA
jgi:hypothetical protein